MIDNFFNISDLSKSLLEDIVFDKVQDITLENKNIGCLYEKPSTRTRLSFTSGINKLKGKAIDIRLEELNFSRKESFEDTFRAIGCYLDGLIYRTSSHNKLISASKFMNKPIINALSDKSHPCQILADLITLYETFKSLELEISWFGDINNVLFSLVEAVNILDKIKLNIFSHSSLIKDINWKLGNKISLFDNINQEIIAKSDCIMTDVFLSMNDENDENKIDLLKQFQVNNNIMKLTRDSCVFMHCLPAKVGIEVTKEVESRNSIVWKQACNRMPAQIRLMKCINW